jgi:2-keto-4-pentenoate hydratase/2-oxohepta-3-ene-1,7-dioic acid hydratase in catechol pathway|tara:strand:+ start:3450 stop:4316 length:867 start_codon:yes stop_codon:yes gene_type:complete
MKIAVFERSGEKYVGQVLENENIIQRFDLTLKDFEFSGVTALIGRDLPLVTEEIPLDEVMLLAPVPRPLRNIFCVGKNYRDHAREFTSSGFDSSANKGTIPKAPIVFSKVPETVIGPGDPIKVDNTVSTEIDYEVELAVIIGKSGRNISREDAVSHVWGYTIINDVTARNLQGLHSQWLIGKSQDTFCPMGPWAVTTDEIDLNDTYIRCWVNGELRQDSNTNLLIFDVPEIISAISNGIMLNCGDVIATGTPAGVGIGFKPPKFLKPGDKTRLEIQGIGVLENQVEGY